MNINVTNVLNVFNVFNVINVWILISICEYLENLVTKRHYIFILI